MIWVKQNKYGNEKTVVDGITFHNEGQTCISRLV